jgi:hypothetical protein
LSGEASPYETKPFFPPELLDGDLDFSLLMRLGDGVSGEEFCDLKGGGDRERERDLDPGGLLL